MKIAFFDAKPYDINSFNKVNEKYKYKIKYFEYKLDNETVKLANGYDVVCVFVNDNIDNEVIDQLYNNGTRLIALRCAGYNNVDFKAAYNKIHVVRVPAYSPYAVAEHAIALIMTLNRKIHKAYNRTRENNFSINGFVGFDLFGKTVGIIGTGKIGRVFADICRGFGMKILAYDLYPDKSSSFEYVTLDELYKRSDIISLHCPLSSTTHHIINEESITHMKDKVYLIKSQRGRHIKTQALIEGTKNTKIGSAGLDVYEEESQYFFEDFSSDVVSDDKLARLLSFNNVIVTSHQAFLTNEALNNIANTTMESIKGFVEGRLLENEVCYQCNKLGQKCNKAEGKPCF